MTLCRMTLLADRGVVEVDGPDATEFLQGLVSADVEDNNADKALFAALLAPQGKILFDFFVLRRAPATYWLECAKAQAQRLIQRLSMYKLRAKITVTERSENFDVAACWGDCAPASVPGILAAYPDPRFAALGSRLILHRGAGRELAAQLGAEAVDAACYAAHRIKLAIPEGGLDYVYGEAFPHEVAFDELHGVDFEKGCFVGQEVVARMHHLGTPKTRLAGVELLETGAGAVTGSEILAGDLRVGRLGSVDGARGIAIVRLDRAEEAQRKGIPLRAGGIALRLRQPPWAKYRVTGNTEST